MSNFSIAARLRSFVYAARGLRLVLRTQHNAWIHAAVSIAVVVMAVGLGVDARGWALLLLAIAMVWAGEAANTAIERLADATLPDPHPLVEQAKDAAAGAVLACAIGAALVGFLVLGPPLWRLLAGWFG